MRLWRRAAAALKDRKSLWAAALSKRHPEIDAAVVRATSHTDSTLDRPKIERALEFIRRTPLNLNPFLRSVSRRMEKTRSWVVALKGLYLMNVVINSKLSGVNRIGRLPFDFSDFKDAHSSPTKSWSFDDFIRAYYAYLDHKTALFYNYTEEFLLLAVDNSSNSSITRELVLLHKLLPLIDLLIQVKPEGRAVSAPLILDVVEEITIEILKIYSRICGGITAVVNNISSADKIEATAALNAIQRGSVQGEQLASYFEYCDRIGVVNFADVSFIDRFSQEGIENLQRRVYAQILAEEEDEEDEEKPIVVIKQSQMDVERKNGFLTTIITHEWEKFDEDSMCKNPFLTMAPHHQNQQLPDLIIL